MAQNKVKLLGKMEKEDGLWIIWHQNGEKMREVQWVDGKRNGKCQEWYDNGAKKLEGKWKNGFKRWEMGLLV